MSEEDLKSKLGHIRGRLCEDHMNVCWDGEPKDPYVRQTMEDISNAVDVINELAEYLGWELPTN